mmetsp:Transcript_103795/g.278852  ORF Transcript_103795/g.278852 Transcript_103795/m.278852 type:complete len:200 (-) Transcript_103795:142-741(-)
MQYLSIHATGSRPNCATKSLRQRCTASHFAAASSCHECERKASTAPKSTLRESARKDGSGMLLAMASRVTLSMSTPQNLFSHTSKRLSTLAWPMSAEIPAAAEMPSPRDARRACMRMRNSGQRAKAPNTANSKLSIWSTTNSTLDFHVLSKASRGKAANSITKTQDKYQKPRVSHASASISRGDLSAFHAPRCLHATTM